MDYYYGYQDSNALELVHPDSMNKKRKVKNPTETKELTNEEQKQHYHRASKLSQEYLGGKDELSKSWQN
jgi:hypothetical protein